MNESNNMPTEPTRAELEAFYEAVLDASLQALQDVLAVAEELPTSAERDAIIEPLIIAAERLALALWRKGQPK